VLVLFFLSGLVGVLTEQVFERLLSVVVGGTTPAAAVVLSIYFLGLGLGSWLAARVLRRAGLSPVRLYGWAELGVALCCGMVLLGFEAVRPWFASLLMAVEGHPAAMMAARSVIAAFVVLPAAFSMGLSFPFLSEYASRSTDRAGSPIARLYMVNLFGAASAALLAPYALFPAVGLAGVLIVCMALDSVVAWVAIRHLPEAPAPAPVARLARRPVEPAHYSLLAVAFFSGLAFFALEVLWTHLTAVAVNSSVYAFSSMLFFVTLGLGMGARASSRIHERGRETPDVGILFLIASGLLLFQTTLWPGLPGSMASMGQGYTRFFEGEIVRWAHLALQLLPVTFIYGMIYPALFGDARIRKGHAAELIGRMGAVNSAGCVLGALLGSFWMLPALGSELSLCCMTAALALAGLLIIVRGGVSRRLYWAGLGAASIVILSFLAPAWNRLALTSGVNVYFALNNVFADSRLQYFHEDAYGGITTVIDNRHMSGKERQILLTNGKFQGDDGPQRDAQIGFTLLPALHAPQWEDALVIGFGTGHSAGVIKELGFDRLDIAEISPGILQASDRFFQPINYGVLQWPRTRVYLEDGRNVLLTRQHRYSVISMELTSIWFAGSSNLYSLEFYRLAHSRLREGGVFQQWLQFHHLSPREISSILATVRAVFPWVTLWHSGGQGIILAADAPRHLEPEAEERALRFLTRHFGGDDNRAAQYLNTLERSCLLDSSAIDRLASSGPHLNTDWNRWLEYATPLYNMSKEDWNSINRAEFQRWASTESVLSSHR
jgi:spermidine synthase